MTETSSSLSSCSKQFSLGLALIFEEKFASFEFLCVSGYIIIFYVVRERPRQMCVLFQAWYKLSLLTPYIAVSGDFLQDRRAKEAYK